MGVAKLLRWCKKNDVHLVAASKGRSVSQIKKLYELGVRSFGENYVQGAEEKIKQLREFDIEWRLIGHLQRNKVKKAVELFDSIDTVDGLGLARKIGEEALRQKKVMPILVQVNISDEQQKSGIEVERLGALLDDINSFESLELVGLMCIASKGQAAVEFQKMKGIFGQYQKKYGLTALSMGMSDDYALAIENGATMVRLGKRLFDGLDE